MFVWSDAFVISCVIFEFNGHLRAFYQSHFLLSSETLVSIQSETGVVIRIYGREVFQSFFCIGTINEI